MKTRTGGFEIGFRRGWSDWQKDTAKLLDWAVEHDLLTIDVGVDAPTLAAAFTKRKVAIGTADLLGGAGLYGDDPAKRDAGVERVAEYIEQCAAAGVHRFFTAIVPENRTRKRSENFAFVVESFHKLVPALEKSGSCIVIEGWPGPGALACTPEGYRALFKEVPSKAMAVNFDPSHLIRMGIDPVRFLEEFAPRVQHAHGKDTEILAEGLYEYGHEQEPTFGTPRGFGGMSWRYTIPGHGCFRWTKGFEILKSAGYTGAVCIELEDERFNTDEQGEKQGLLAGARFLASC